MHSLSKIFHISIRRIRLAGLTYPARESWKFCVWMLLFVAILILPVGLRSNFLVIGFPAISWQEALWTVIIVFIAPAVLEECFWRVVMLPHRSEGSSVQLRLRWGLVSLGLFTIAHPLNALTFYPAGFPTFTNPVFLFSVVALGLICMISYWQSGSLWTSVTIHWVVVVVWLLCLGGYDKLHVI